LTHIFVMLVHINLLWVIFEGQGHRSNFTVTGRNNSNSDDHGAVRKVNVYAADDPGE